MTEPAPRQSAADILYNPLRPEFAQNPYPALHRLRAADPVHYSPLLGVWVLTKYADVSAALRDPRLSAAARNWKGYERFFLRPQLESNPLDEMYKRWMLQLDAPDHTRLRALVSAAFTPRAVQHMRGRIRAIVDGLLDAMQAAGSFDAIADFAHPLPVVAIADMLGVPAEDHARVKAWSHDLLPSFSPSLSLAALKNVNHALGEFRDYFAQLVERRRANPGDDLLSGLINARFEQDKLDDEELFATCILLTFAGHASTVQSISNLLLILAIRPEILAAVRGQPKLLMGAIEEVLRFEAPLQLIYRTTKVEVEIGGKTIAPREMIFLSLPAANRDPERFADPDTFDPARTDNRHLAFGYGAHFCAGAGLARLETMIAVEAFLERFPTFEIAGAVPPREASLLLRGLTKLPMRVGA